MLAAGVDTSGNYMSGSVKGWHVFGSYVGFTLMLVYTGRHYYWHVLRGAVGRRILHQRIDGYRRLRQAAGGPAHRSVREFRGLGPEEGAHDQEIERFQRLLAVRSIGVRNECVFPIDEHRSYLITG